MTTRHHGLEPIEPGTARELYLEHKRTAYTEATVRNHRYQTEKLVEWCEERGIDNLNDLAGRDVQEHRLWRKEGSDVTLLTLNKYMSVVRVFLKWCASIAAVPRDLPEKITIPRVSPESQRDDTIIRTDTANEILEYLDRFHYASLDHVLFALLRETGVRIGAARGVDVPDVETREERVVLRHRPDRDTTLKNGARRRAHAGLLPKPDSHENQDLDSRHHEVLLDGRGLGPRS